MKGRGEASKESKQDDGKIFFFSLMLHFSLFSSQGKARFFANDGRRYE